MNTKYNQLITNFVAWAKDETNIRAAMIIGSQARSDHPADQWADLDLIVITQNAPQFAQDEQWITQIGEPIFTFMELTPSGDPERRVLFRGGEHGLDIDFSILPLDKAEALLHMSQLGPALSADLFNTFGRGMCVLLDKDDLAARLQKLLTSIAAPTPAVPSAAVYQGVVSDFWYHALWSAKHLRRGELWWAKSGCDMRLKHLLLTMLEWHARFTPNEKHDTWFRGRFLETWVNPQAREELAGVFAHYDEADIWRALLATMVLFRWLAQATAQSLGYLYPAEGDSYVSRQVIALSRSVQ
jgi:aminoglycoside 6-adenylyltransferase